MTTPEEKPTADYGSPRVGQIEHAQDEPPHHGMSVGQYMRTRLTSLKPPMTALPNPFRLIAMLSGQQWAFFLVAFFAWTWDAFDFFTVSLTVSELSKTFDKSTADITWGITLVLMFRSVGSILFGIAADRYGRKWPFVVNNVLFIILELGTGFTQTYSQFLACRALFGIAMGGLYGNAAATALEDLPEVTRGLMSGILQQGYAFGYLLATAFARGLVNTTGHEWRPLFWFGACPPVLIIIFRLLLPETNVHQARESVRRTSDAAGTSISKTFLREGKVALKRHWLLLVYLVLLMAGFNFMSHGSQDLYPTMLENQFGFNANQKTVTQVVANLGAMTGGTVVGFLSQTFGRRLSIIVICVVGGALLYPYTFVSSERIIAAAFFEQFCVQGAWGVIPIHLMELSPGAFRTFVVGTSYQLGNLVSSASSTIEATLGERFPLPPEGETKRYNYGKVICIFMGCVYAYVILLTFLGPEHLRRKFEVEHDADLREIANEETIEQAIHRRERKGVGRGDEDTADAAETYLQSHIASSLALSGGYATSQSILSILKINRYETKAKKTAGWNNTAKQRLRATRHMIVVGYVPCLLSSIMAVNYLVFVPADDEPLVAPWWTLWPAVLAAALCFGVCQYMLDFWATEARVPMLDQYNEAVAPNRVVIAHLGLLSAQWGIMAVLKWLTL